MKEEDIRPKVLFDELIRLAEVDADRFFSGEERSPIDCPACGFSGTTAFEKNGFSYEECSECRSLYVSPRPPAKAFERYYTESSSSKFWATTFYKQTADSRREQLWIPKAKIIKGILDKFGVQNGSVYDIGGGYGIFAEEMKRLGVRTTVIEPAPHLAAICKEKGITTIQAFLEEIDQSQLERGPKIFVSFELFEHLHSPADFLKRVASLLDVDDLFTFTTLSGTGLDIRVLWENSKAVMPPYHLNFLNPVALKYLLERVGFEILEITTPGKLDISILENNRTFVEDRFWQTFLDLASDSQKDSMQDAIANSGWSSHMMATCRKAA